jgi:alpha-D-ribose 1-methylphosphonate 5-triphosphate diphosphatase
VLTTENAVAAGVRTRVSRSGRGAASAPAHAAFSLTNAIAVLPAGIERATLVVRDGLIHRVNAAHAATARRVDCAGDYLLPGLIELHTDNLERHIEPRPGTFWSSDRAVLSHDAELAAAGITTACDAITLGADTGEGARELAYLESITSVADAEAQGLLRANHLLHVRCELGSARLLESLQTAIERRTPSVISLMEHVPGYGQWRDVALFRKHYARRYNLTADQLEALVARRKADREQFAASNRAVVVDAAGRCGSRLASHDDAFVMDVDQAAQTGCTICEFPTSLEAARAAHQRQMFVIAGSPNIVRGGSHSGNVAASSLAAEGLIDILSSDYCPSSLLQAVFLVASSGIVSLAAAVSMVTSVPARALNLHDRGAIEEGRRADLVRVRNTPRGPVVVNAWCGGRQVA